MSIARTVRSLTPAQQTLAALAVATTLSGLFHIGVWEVAGQPSLVGPVTWRKPIAFGLSIGVLAASLVWVVSLLPDTAALRRQAVWVAVLLVAELLLIDVQQWRGVGSHFNVTTPLDALVFQAMGLLILAVAAILAWWTWRLWMAPHTDAAPEHLAAARAGMLLLAAGNVIGIALAVWGTTMLERTGHVPQAMGAAGNLKLTHAVALHGLQVLPIVAVLTSTVTDARRRLRLVRLAATGYTALLGVALWQAIGGRAPADLALPVAVVIACAVTAVCGPAIVGLSTWLTRRAASVARA